MSWTRSATRGNFTPSASDDNWFLYAQNRSVAYVISIHWSGRLTTPAAYRTRWCRPTTVPTLTASVACDTMNPDGSAINSIVSIGRQASPVATLPADPINLFAHDWNARGGDHHLILPLQKAWIFVGVGASGTASASFLCCRNTAGFDANGSSYSVQWRE